MTTKCPRKTTNYGIFSMILTIFTIFLDVFFDIFRTFSNDFWPFSEGFRHHFQALSAALTPGKPRLVKFLVL